MAFAPAKLLHIAYIEGLLLCRNVDSFRLILLSARPSVNRVAALFLRKFRGAAFIIGAMRPRDALAVAVERCGSKFAYKTWADAEHAALSLIEDIRDGRLIDTKGGGLIAPYQCRFCDKWHVGHQATRDAVNRFWGHLGPKH